MGEAVNLDLLIAELKRDEGVRPKPYVDSVGKLTVGVGRNLTDMGLSPAEIDILLRNDIAAACSLLDDGFPEWRDLDEVRQRVLVNLAFNLGPKILGFKNTLAAVKTGNYVAAASGMLKSLWASQVGVRAQRLARMMVTGEAVP